MPIVDNTVLHTQKNVKKVDLMLSGLITHKKSKTKKQKEYKETFGGDRYVYYLVCGDGNTSVYICPNSQNCTHKLRAVFLYTNYTSKKWEKHPGKT